MALSRLAHSFRLRIALLTLLLSGAVLLLFGGAGWLITYRQSMARVEREIRELGHRELSRMHGPEHWGQVGRSLKFIFEADQRPGGGVVLLAWDRAGTVLHRSEAWPAAVGPDDLPRLPPASGPSPRSPGKRPAGKRPAGKRPPRRDFVARLDRDHDGRVSADEFDGPSHHFAALDRDGDGQLDESEVPGPPGQDPRGFKRPPPAGALPRAEVRGPRFVTLAQGVGRYRVGVMANPLATVAIGVDLAGVEAQMAAVTRAFALALPLALLLVAGGGWLIAGRSLGPVRALTRHAEGVTARGLDQRIPAGDEAEEFARLIRVFNGMLDRLERAFHQATRFSADAAHELNTPLTILQGHLAQCLNEAEEGSPAQQHLAELLEELQRLKAIVRKLLTLSLADRGELALRHRPVDLSALAEGLAEDLAVLAPGASLEHAVAPGITIAGDRDLLGQVLHNLATNAARYTPEGGTIRLELGQDAEGRAARLTLTNSGEPIPPEAAGRIFERFYRVDKARSRAHGGAGLGLSLAREIVRAHGGELRLLPNPERAPQNTFTLTLPLAGSGLPDSAAETGRRRAV